MILGLPQECARTLAHASEPSDRRIAAASVDPGSLKARSLATIGRCGKTNRLPPTSDLEVDRPCAVQKLGLVRVSCNYPRCMETLRQYNAALQLREARSVDGRLH